MVRQQLKVPQICIFSTTLHTTFLQYQDKLDLLPFHLIFFFFSFFSQAMDRKTNKKMTYNRSWFLLEWPLWQFLHFTMPVISLIIFSNQIKLFKTNYAQNKSTYYQVLISNLIIFKSFSYFSHSRGKYSQSHSFMFIFKHNAEIHQIYTGYIK